MILKYVDTNSSNVTITRFNSVELLRVDNDAGESCWALVFYPMAEPIIIQALCTSFSLCNDYLNKIYENEKIDISADSNFFVKVENLTKDLDSIFGILYGDDKEEDE